MFDSDVIFVDVMHRKNIETKIPIVLDNAHVTLRGFGQQLLFMRRDGGLRCRKIIAAGFDFDKNQRVVFFGDNVEFGASVSPVGFQNRTTRFLQIFDDGGFARIPDVQMFCHV